ncbi:MAG: hypothetical protein HGA97_06955 [Chlorobiaceae bacterium]|nr:hypothetical protein [Chlorobiaceae bacterium]
MEKIDFRKEWKQLYNPSPKEVVKVEVPEMRFLMIDGEGDPETTPAFHEDIEVLFSLSYTIKFMVKKGVLQTDYAVMPLEGLWWADDMNTFSSGDKAKWKWTLMVMQPEWVTEEMVAVATEEVRKKKALPALDGVRFERYAEGVCAQIMHIGLFSEEGPTIERMHRFIADAGCRLSGKHHEIYLSDTRKADPAKWKTILRQPMA